MTSRGIITIAGATGVVGRHIIAQGRKAGYRLRALSRRATADLPKDVEVFEWHPKDGAVQSSTVEALDGAAAVVNLAGSSIDDGRLNESHKEKVLKSRVDATKALTGAFERCATKPSVWLQASAIGYYGDTADRTVTEQSPSSNHSFLAEVCRQWEAEAWKLTERHPESLRMVIGRIGLVLAKEAPAWKKLVLPIRLGIGGKLGSGQQWYSWIDADDLARAALFLVEKSQARGVHNLTAPHPVRQGELARLAGKKLRRPAWVRTPAFALRAALGDTADYLVLASCKALPTALLEAGFVFQRPDIESELAHLL